jgi:hypothetical protein
VGPKVIAVNSAVVSLPPVFLTVPEPPVVKMMVVEEPVVIIVRRKLVIPDVERFRIVTTAPLRHHVTTTIVSKIVQFAKEFLTMTVIRRVSQIHPSVGMVTVSVKRTV